MEATKKTSTTKAALLVVAALSMLLSGLFIATASRSDASPPPACPDGFSLTADAKNCFQAAVVTSADNPNSCDTGLLTPDGTKCYVAARIIPQEGQTLCPKGYSPDDSLGAMCARFENALQRAAACPDGARGVSGACYILVAKGPRGTSTCATVGAVLAGTNCVITGAAPASPDGSSTCPVSSTVLQDGSECYTLVGRPAAASCVSPYVMFGSVCKVSNPNPTSPTLAPTWACPAGPTGVTPTGQTHTIGGITKIESCSYPLASVDMSCPTGSVDRDGDPTTGDCRRPVDLVPGAKVCGEGYGIIDGKCIRYVAPATPNAACPSGSLEHTDGECRKPVADAAGVFYCASADAALNGKSCVYTSGFLINPAPNLYKCESGTRAVIGGLLSVASAGDGTNATVICLLGDANANTTTGPSCLQGVLSTDNAYCIVPRIDTAPAAAVAAPVPSFTG